MSDSSQFERLNARAEELVTERANTDSLWREIDDNLFGIRSFRTQRTPGQKRLQRIYDDTSKVSAELLAGAYHSLTVPLGTKWFGLVFENPELNDIQEAMAWLQAVEKRMYAALAAPTANFHAGVSEVFGDLVRFGNGGLFIDDVPGVGIQFSARPLDELYFAEDPSGRIDTISRVFRLTARQAVDQWGDAAVAATKKANTAGQSEEKDEYVHIILPSEEVIAGNIDASGMPWASFHLSRADNSVLSSKGFFELPMATPRWTKNSGEVYGRGPGGNALANQKMLNEMKRVKIGAGQLNIKPVVLFDNEAVTPASLRWNPGARIPVNSVMSTMNPPLQTFQAGGDSRMTVEDMIEARKSIQDAFQHQLIETIRDPRMTATQVLELSAQMQRHLAPILGRLETELLEVIVERVFAIEERAGRFPDAPPEIAGQPLKINYESPIGRSQRVSDAKAIMAWTDYVVNTSAVSQEVLDVVDFDEATREVAETLGVPFSVVRDPRAVERRREAAAELAAEEKSQQEAVMATDQIAKLAKAMPQGAAAQ